MSRSNLSYACKNRSCQVLENFFLIVLNQCLNKIEQANWGKKFRFKAKLYIVDSTLIKLCLKLFPWAEYRSKQGGIKAHFLLNANAEVPVFMVMKEGKPHDIKIIKNEILPLKKGDILTGDRGYFDTEWFNNLDEKGISFVVRSKKNIVYRVKRVHSCNETGNIKSDEIIELLGVNTREKYSRELRIVKVYDEKNKRNIELITNNFDLSASTIGQIYRRRWDIEVFFSWIKRNLKIKHFIGRTENAVMLQLLVSMIYYLILNMLRVMSNGYYGLLEIHRRLNSTIFKNIKIKDMLSPDSS